MFSFHLFWKGQGMTSGPAEYWVAGNGAIMILSEYVLYILQLINLSPADARWETHYFNRNMADRGPPRFLGFLLSICHMYTFISRRTEKDSKIETPCSSLDKDFYLFKLLEVKSEMQFVFAAMLLHSLSTYIFKAKVRQTTVLEINTIPALLLVNGGQWLPHIGQYSPIAKPFTDRAQRHVRERKPLSGKK